MPTIKIPVLQGSKLQQEVEVSDTLTVGEPQDGCHTFRILDPLRGDERITWDPLVLDQIRDAKKLFLQLVAKGLKPFRINPDGKKDPKIMEEFDATAGEIVFLPTPAIRGG